MALSTGQRPKAPNRLQQLREQMDAGNNIPTSRSQITNNFGPPTFRPGPGQPAPTGAPAPAPIGAAVKQQMPTKTPDPLGDAARGGTAPPPNATGAVPQAPDKSGNPGQDALDAAANKPATIDQREEDFIRSLLEGASNVDTSEQEKLIRELMGDQMGQSLADQRASMGRAGFGSSGALGAIEGDVMRKARQGESQAILDERERAKQEAIQNALSGVGADVNLREAGMNEWLLEQILNLANGNPVEQPPAQTGGGDLGRYQLTSGIGHGGADVNNTELHSNLNESTSHYPASSEAYMDSDLVDQQGYKKTVGDDGATVYTSPDGKTIIRAIFDG